MHFQPSPWMPDTLQAMPAPDQPGSLLVLLHGWGSRAEDMEHLAHALCPGLPQPLALAPQGFEPSSAQQGGRQWFDVNGMTVTNRAERIARVLPRLVHWVQEAQRRAQVSPSATTLAGFSQGASLAIELALAHDGLAARVLAFAGRCVAPLTQAPRNTALHFLLGAEDPLISTAQSEATVSRLRSLGGNATLDVAPGLGHGIDASLINMARCRLAGPSAGSVPPAKTGTDGRSISPNP